MANRTKGPFGFARVTAFAAFFVVTSFAQAQSQQNSSQAASLKAFLRDCVGSPSSGNNDTTKYFSTFVDLRDDGMQEAIVYLTGVGWCGSGGCTTLVLAPNGSFFKVITKITITKLPIRVLATKSHGWHDISVVARIDGVEPTYEAKLSFNGKSYPSNPSVRPAQRLIGNVDGKTVIPLEANGIALFQ
jgi:hypothetical protein